MKNRLIKIWSIVLTVSILAGLLVFATPANAGTLSWTAEPAPSATGGTFTTSQGPWIMDVAPDGKTFFAYDGTNLYKSTDGGLTFSANTTGVGLAASLVALAISPDYATNPIVAAASTSTVYYSINGSSFTALNSAGLTGTIVSVDVAPYWQGNIGILVGTTTGAFLAQASTQGFAGAFAPVVGTEGQQVLGVAFSPNHKVDAMMYFVTANASGTYVSNKFANTPVNNQFGAARLTTDVPAGAVPAFFAFPADFDREGNNRFFVALSSHDVYRVSVGVGATASTAADLNLSGDAAVLANVRSVSFKGNIADGYLFVGLASPLPNSGALIYRATSATATTLTWTPTSKLSGSSNAIVIASPASGDTNVYALTSGTGSAFQVSTDNAATFNLVSLISTTDTPAVTGVAIVDANNRYMIMDINGATAGNNVLFKSTNGGTSWQGISSGAFTDIFLSPAFATDNTLFVINKDSNVIRRSNNGGTSFSNVLNANAGNTSAFAVVDANTFFVGGSGSVYKSGTSTAAPVAGVVTSLVAIDANTIVAGTDIGNVYLSTNGGTSYTLLGGAAVGTGATYVMPDANYATNKIIYAASAAGIDTWTVDTSTAWSSIPGPGATIADITGLVMGSEGTIYASSPRGVLRSLDGYNPIPSFGSTATLAPAKILKVAGTGTPTAPANTLYVITGGTTLRSFTDTLVTAPATTAPAKDASVSKNTVFTWAPLPVPAGYTVLYELKYTDAASFALNTWVNVPTLAVGATSYAVPTANALVPGGKYYWTVKAVQVNGNAYSSKAAAPVSFGVKLNETAGDITTLMSPGPGATGIASKPTFQWTPVNGATGYDLQVSDNPVFVNPIDNQTNLATNVWTLTKTLDFNKTYYWRVRAVNGNTGVVGDWVQQAFTTAPAPVTTTSVPPTTITTTAPPQTTTATVTVAPTTTTMTFTVPTQTAPTPATPAYIWVIIAIGAILVIAVIVLIARTRRV